MGAYHQWTMGKKVYLIIGQVLLLSSTTAAIFLTQKFLTGPLYRNSVLAITPYRIRAVWSIQECHALCSASPLCRAVAIGISCTPQCLLYNTNACVNSTVAVKAQATYTIWDKVNPKANMACKDEATFRACIPGKFDRCGGCEREFFHGTDCQYARRGCPGKYQFHDGMCSLIVTKDRQTYQKVEAECSSRNGGRFAVVRNTYANSMLNAWLNGLKSQGLASAIFIGIDRLQDQKIYWRKDGLLANATYRAWAPGEPSALMQDSVAMLPLETKSYFDDLSNLAYYYICQVHEDICNEYDEWTSDNNGNCYYLHRTVKKFDEAKLACIKDNGTLAAVRDMDTHLLLVSLMTNWNATSTTKAYIGVKSNMTQTVYMDGTKVTFPGELWGDQQPNHINETVAYLNSNGQWYDEIDGTARDYVCEYIASSCSEWYGYGHRENHMYRLLLQGAKVDVEAYCDMTSNGGGWTVFQARRGNSSVNFNRSLSDYNSGFGNASNDFWLGNHQLFLLTNQEEVELCIEMTELDGTEYSVSYSLFKLIQNGTDHYTFQVGSFQSNSASVADDRLLASQGLPFSTYDDDQSAGHCAQYGYGGWWFTHDCIASSNLNGAYPNASAANAPMTWHPGKPLLQVVMKLRRTDFFRRA